MYEIHIVMEVRTLCLNFANRKISQGETSVTWETLTQGKIAVHSHFGEIFKRNCIHTDGESTENVFQIVLGNSSTPVWKKKTKFDLAYSSPDICDVWFVEVQVSYGFEN